MSPIPSWHPHATWDAFIPRADGSVALLQASDVERALDELASIPVESVRLPGAESGHRHGAIRLLRRASEFGIEFDVPLLAEVGTGEIDMLAEAGVRRVSVPVEGPDAAAHDHYRQAPGEFERTERFAELVRTWGILLDVRTSLHDGSSGQWPGMLDTVERLGASRWTVQAPLAPNHLRNEALEQALSDLAKLAPHARCAIASRYAPFFLRLCEWNGAKSLCSARSERNGLCILPTGHVTPDPAIPVYVGDVRRGNLAATFDGHPLLRALRDPDAVEGKCGRCEFRTVCGGSRARAWTLTSNLFASDPACSYEA